MKNTKKRRMLFAILIGAIALVPAGGDGGSRAMEPCPSFQQVQLTGTLIEVRQGEVVVPSEEAILDGVPRFTCVSSTNPGQQTTWVTVADCDFPQSSVNVMLAP